MAFIVSRIEDQYEADITLCWILLGVRIDLPFYACFSCRALPFADSEHSRGTVIDIEGIVLEWVYI